MEVPARWRKYTCLDYFCSPIAVTGCWDDGAEHWLIEPADRIEEDLDAGFLQVGSPGVDSIGFGYRQGHPGFWAFHRMIDQDFQFLAPTIQEFLKGWFAGRITV
jgi:hypothetical protein